MFRSCLYLVFLIHLTAPKHFGSTTNNNSSQSTFTPLRGEKYNILCWLPVPIKSHQRLVEPLLRELAKRGHQITLVTPMPLPDPPENLHQVTIKNQYDLLEAITRPQSGIDKIIPIGMMHSTLKYMESIFEDPLVQEFLNSERKFDVIIMESMVMNEPFIGLHHKYKAPVIEILPVPNFHWAYFNLGIPYDTSYIADTMATYTDRMTFSERLINTGLSLTVRAAASLLLHTAYQHMMNRHLRYPGWEERPRLADMLSNISLALINTHFSLSYPYPLPPHAKEIAGINMPPPQPLPKDILEFMDSASEGVILFSLGSHISMSKRLGAERTRVFTKFFSTVKQKVLWKWDENDFPAVSSNVKIVKWFPQTDVLAHKNCRLFITHGGLHSSMEAMYNGVAVVAIPLQGDQMKNARMLSHHGVGLILTLDNITEQTLSSTVNQVLTNNTYKENARRRSLIYRDSKFSPLETAVYWTEYVLRHKGAPHLKPAPASMPWYQQAMFDVYAAMLALAVTTLYIIFKLMKCMFQLLIFCFCRSSNKNKKE